jgi:hypothetical protein
MGMALVLKQLVAMGFSPQRARRAYKLVPEAKDLSLSQAVTECSSLLMMDGAVPEAEGDQPAPPPPKPQRNTPVTKTTKKRARGVVDPARQPPAKRPRPKVASRASKAAAATGGGHELAKVPQAKPEYLPMPSGTLSIGYRPFEDAKALRRALEAHKEGGRTSFFSLPAQLISGIGPQEQRWLEGLSLGTMGELMNMPSTDPAAKGKTAAEEAKLQRHHDSVRLACMTVSACVLSLSLLRRSRSIHLVSRRSPLL